jgi:hypothetical protein
MDRTEIGNCIIAGIAEGGTCLEQMSEIVTRLELAGWVIVPKEPTKEMKTAGAEAMPDYDPSVDDAEQCWGAMIDAAVARS